jgi:hypothetical protein
MINIAYLFLYNALQITTHIARKDVPYVWNPKICNIAFEDSYERLYYIEVTGHHK